METKTLISPQELASTTESIVIIDTRDPSEYAIAHIPNAVNIRDIFTYLATSTPEGIKSLQAHFAELLGNAGLSGSETAVIYEDAMDKGYGQSCRGYFLLKYLGYPKVSILHGGYKAWLSAGLPVTDKVMMPEKKIFPLDPNESIMVTAPQMLDVIDNPAIVKLDVRDKDEWVAESSSPYGKDFCPRMGRIPNSVWIEWYDLMVPSAEVPTFRSKDEILDICHKVGISPEQPVFIYCFKGSRASNTMVALKEAGFSDVRNYFASWNEWSRDEAFPIETGVPA
jgi:thiosulfate/3-mercaptopyruvate sulfurtransferase